MLKFPEKHVKRQDFAKKMSSVEKFYETYDEEGRVLTKHGRVEDLTTMRYIEKCLSGIPRPSIIEIGAGTGRYSVTLAKEGYSITAVELVQKNIDMMSSKLDGTEDICIMQKNALDLSSIHDESFDLTMLLGPMYHLYTKEDRLKALSEAVRITKPGGYILVAYCMNEAVIVQYLFGFADPQKPEDLYQFDKVTEDWRCKSTEKEIFSMVWTEDIAELDAHFPVERDRLVATDGATNYNRTAIDSMDNETFGKWLDFHFAICERQDLVGASNHVLDILKKR